MYFIKAAQLYWLWKVHYSDDRTLFSHTDGSALLDVRNLEPLCMADIEINTDSLLFILSHCVLPQIPHPGKVNLSVTN